MLQEQSFKYDKLSEFISTQYCFENKLSDSHRKQNGVYLTQDVSIIESVLSCITFDKTIFAKLIFEPSCGQGAFLISIIWKVYIIDPCQIKLDNFIKSNLYFADICQESINSTIANISHFYEVLFKKKYNGNFNSFCIDFTLKLSNDSKLYSLYNKFDYIIGNPPYIALYGRRDKKRNEDQRIYYLNNYSQFPHTLKNGKINYVMLFLEHGLDFLKKDGVISYIIDLSFFETAYKYCRKYLLENTNIIKLVYNVKGFDSVGSGQIMLSAKKGRTDANEVYVIDSDNGVSLYVNQDVWYNDTDEYKFRINNCIVSNSIIDKIYCKKNPTLKELYPKKNLRTCVMLLDMEDKFTTENKPVNSSFKIYPYYQGSKGIKYKYSKPQYKKFFIYNKSLQDNINADLKDELTKMGIKNKKRLGLGEQDIYDNPKVYIRQSAKELIATYDESPSSANNSLYVFSLRNNSDNTRFFLKYLCGLLNSKLYTFFAQQRRIIRYNKGKQPQIKTSDLYEIQIPLENSLQEEIVFNVESVYKNPVHLSKAVANIDLLLYDYYQISKDEAEHIELSIKSFVQ